MDPITDVTIVKSLADLGRKLYEIAKNLKDREIKKTVDDVIDELRDLKQRASDLEDENRKLREQLRFKNDDFEFRNPFHYEKKYPDRPLCAKCFAKKVTAPMSEPYEETYGGRLYRRCLVCENAVKIERSVRANTDHSGQGGGPNGWMER